MRGTSGLFICQRVAGVGDVWISRSPADEEGVVCRPVRDYLDRASDLIKLRQAWDVLRKVPRVP